MARQVAGQFVSKSFPHERNICLDVGTDAFCSCEREPTEVLKSRSPRSGSVALLEIVGRQSSIDGSPKTGFIVPEVLVVLLTRQSKIDGPLATILLRVAHCLFGDRCRSRLGDVFRDPLDAVNRQQFSCPQLVNPKSRILLESPESHDFLVFESVAHE